MSVAPLPSGAPDPAFPEDRRRLLDDLGDLDHAFYGLWRGRDDIELGRRPEPGSWSLVEIVHHVAVTDAAYFDAMEKAVRARSPGPADGRPLVAGPLERLFLAWLEPPVRWRMPAPRRMRPSATIEPAAAWQAFQEIHGRVRDWVRTAGELDLNRVRFGDPFLTCLRLRVGTGLLVILAHGRRHLAQARRVVARLELDESARTRRR